MKTKVAAGAIIAIIGFGLIALTFSQTQAQDSEPSHKTFSYREWYLQGVWQVYAQTPDNSVLSDLFGLSDTYIRNYIVPNTGEDFQTAKTRIASSLGPDPSPLQIHTAVILESYTVGNCSGQFEGPVSYTHLTLPTKRIV